MKLRARLGYTAAVLTMVAAILTPFVLFKSITKGVVALGLHVDEIYSGGPKVRTIEREAYSIDVHRTVIPQMLQKEKPFVQLDWRPISALPAHVADVVDVDGDGQPDLRVSFNSAVDSKGNLHVNVEPLSPRFEAVKNAGKERYSRLIVRVDNSILVRVPVAQR